MVGVGLRMSIVCALVMGVGGGARAQEGAEIFAGALGGVSALSADTTSTTGTTFRLSTYAPQNGAALNVFAGVHLTDYATLQGNYFWNRNEVRLETAMGTPSSSGFDAVTTRTSQHNRGRRVPPLLPRAPQHRQALPDRGGRRLPALQPHARRPRPRSHAATRGNLRPGHPGPAGGRRHRRGPGRPVVDTLLVQPRASALTPLATV